MNTNFKRSILSSALIALIFILANCTNPFSLRQIEESTLPEGSLVININSYGTMALVPDLDMSPASYIISGAGPDGSGFSESTDVTPLIITDLDFGDWTVTVDALNDEGTIIGRGQGTTTIHAGQSQTITVPVTPLDGYGTLDLTLLWTPEDTENPSIEAQLIPQAGSAIDLGFTIQSPGIALFNDSTIPTGYYTLVLQLNDNSIMVMGAVEMVRLVKDQVTSGQFEFYDINDAGESIDISVTPELSDPIAVTLSGQIDNIYEGESMTVTASVPPDVGNVVYTWYINGESRAIGSSYTLGSDLAVGIYRLDVTVFSADGSRAGSTTHTFTVLDNQLAQTTLEWDENSESDLAGYMLYYGFSSGDYQFSVDVGNQTTYTLTNLEPGKDYYITATAYNTTRLESEHSNELIFRG
jgi:hypothetical protein